MAKRDDDDDAQAKGKSKWNIGALYLYYLERYPMATKSIGGGCVAASSEIMVHFIEKRGFGPDALRLLRNQMCTKFCISSLVCQPTGHQMSLLNEYLFPEQLGDGVNSAMKSVYERLGGMTVFRSLFYIFLADPLDMLETQGVLKLSMVVQEHGVGNLALVLKKTLEGLPREVFDSFKQFLGSAVLLYFSLNKLLPLQTHGIALSCYGFMQYVIFSLAARRSVAGVDKK